jgi:hypothetical protein
MINRNDTRSGRLMLVGIGLSIGAVFMALFGFVVMLLVPGGAGLWIFMGVAPLMLTVGVIMMATVIFAGLKKEKQGDAGGNLRIEHGAWIQARFATIAATDEMIFSEEFFIHDDPGTKLFVRLKYPDGRTDEPKTNIHVWRECGEGLVGIAEIQGDWLVRFTAQPRPTGPPRTH